MVIQEWVTISDESRNTGSTRSVPAGKNTRLASRLRPPTPKPSPPANTPHSVRVVGPAKVVVMNFPAGHDFPGVDRKWSRRQPERA